MVKYFGGVYIFHGTERNETERNGTQGYFTERNGTQAHFTERNAGLYGTERHAGLVKPQLKEKNDLILCFNNLRDPPTCYFPALRSGVCI